MHLTLNAEHDRYRWGPITQAPSLLDGDGGFPRTVDDLWDHADLDEVRRELRAQIERAILWGFDVSHLDPTWARCSCGPSSSTIYLELAVEFALPMRLRRRVYRGRRRLPVPAAGRRGGRRLPRPLRPDWRVGSRERVLKARRRPRAGRHRAARAPGDRHARGRGRSSDVAEQWIDDLALVTTDPTLANALAETPVRS